jgi:hypothetical protein
VTLTEALAERAARGELTLPEMQSAVAILLRDLLSRGDPSGAVSSIQDDVLTRKIVAPQDQES